MQGSSGLSNIATLASSSGGYGSQNSIFVLNRLRSVAGEPQGSCPVQAATLLRTALTLELELSPLHLHLPAAGIPCTPCSLRPLHLHPLHPLQPAPPAPAPLAPAPSAPPAACTPCTCTLCTPCSLRPLHLHPLHLHPDLVAEELRRQRPHVSGSLRSRLK
ncbi:hypothetical protein VULLAG_LOCUS12932 [Vulpes lagopus]